MRALILPLALLPLGCGSSTPASGGTPEAAPPTARPTAKPVTPDVSAPPPVVSADPPPPPDGCYTGVSAGKTPEETLQALAERCAEGTRAVLSDPLVVSLEEGGIREIPVTITDTSTCVRALAAGGAGVQELSLTIVDRSDTPLEKDVLSGGKMAVTPREGPLCFKSAGVYRAVAKVEKGKGKVALQLYRTK